MEVRLKGQASPVTLVEVERDDDTGVIGTTNSGKRFVARRDRIAKPLPARHPFRIYRRDGYAMRAIDPAFEEVEEFFLSDADDDELIVTLEDGSEQTVTRTQMLSVLSAMPEDQRSVEAQANGHAEADDPEAVHADADASAA